MYRSTHLFSLPRIVWRCRFFCMDITAFLFACWQLSPSFSYIFLKHEFDALFLHCLSPISVSSSQKKILSYAWVFLYIFMIVCECIYRAAYVNLIRCTSTIQQTYRQTYLIHQSDNIIPAKNFHRVDCVCPYILIGQVTILKTAIFGKK